MAASQVGDVGVSHPSITNSVTTGRVTAQKWKESPPFMTPGGGVNP